MKVMKKYIPIRDFEQSIYFFEMLDTCKGYGKAYMFLHNNIPFHDSASWNRFMHKALRLYGRLTPEQRFILADF